MNTQGVSVIFLFSANSCWQRLDRRQILTWSLIWKRMFNRISLAKPFYCFTTYIVLIFQQPKIQFAAVFLCSVIFCEYQKFVYFRITKIHIFNWKMLWETLGFLWSKVVMKTKLFYGKSLLKVSRNHWSGFQRISLISKVVCSHLTLTSNSWHPPGSWSFFEVCFAWFEPANKNTWYYITIKANSKYVVQTPHSASTNREHSVHAISVRKASDSCRPCKLQQFANNFFATSGLITIASEITVWNNVTPRDTLYDTESVNDDIFCLAV